MKKDKSMWPWQSAYLNCNYYSCGIKHVFISLQVLKKQMNLKRWTCSETCWRWEITMLCYISTSRNSSHDSLSFYLNTGYFLNIFGRLFKILNTNDILTKKRWGGTLKLLGKVSWKTILRRKDSSIHMSKIVKWNNVVIVLWRKQKN